MDQWAQYLNFPNTISRDVYWWIVTYIHLYSVWNVYPIYNYLWGAVNQSVGARKKRNTNWLRSSVQEHCKNIYVGTSSYNIEQYIYIIYTYYIEVNIISKKKDRYLFKV